MERFLIKRVRYNGEQYAFESPELTVGLNIIEGRNGNGKSTFMNLIYFGLSGKVEEFTPSNKNTHFEITKDKSNYVSLDVIVEGESYSFVRYINSNDITVLFSSGEVKVFPIIRSKNEKDTFSDWILEKLSIDTVDVFQGINVSKINFKDLLRLIYHNQELNPKKIFKPADAENFISDSVLIRKIIFELLIGKTYSEYYTTFAKFKEKEKERNSAKSLLEEFDAFIQSFGNKEDVNLVFLNKEKSDKQEQLEKISVYRETLKEAQKPKSKFASQIAELQSAILKEELRKTDLIKTYNEGIQELSNLNRLKDNIVLEVTQISKIIHSHERLALFAVDTCPYCLRGFEREKGHCVCGKTIEEEQYERFFYSSEEYSDILKSKQKSIDTVNLAITSCEEHCVDCRNEVNALNTTIEAYRESISKWISEYEFTSNSKELKQADDTILSIRNDISNLNQRIELEEKRNKLLQRFNTANSSFEGLRAKVIGLESSAKADIKDKIDQFNVIYNDLMISTVKNVRSAALDYEDYMPLLDGGMYKEASSSVATRMMYFLTLLKLSLENTEVKYPKLLLIDTPETAGVDSDNLINIISKISDVSNGHGENEYQIILTTGLGKYPDTFKSNVLLTLTDQNRLLVPKELTDPELLR